MATAPDSPAPVEAHRPPGARPALVYSLCLALLCGVLFTLFFLTYSLLAAHPEHAPGLAQRAYAAVVLGVAALAVGAVAVFGGLVRPLREGHRRAQELRDALEQHSHHDPLTRALNRVAFDQMIVRALEALRRYGAGFCGLMADVDGFRAVNEAHGYEAGDRVLAELAQLLRGHIRKADSLFRWRSGRFLILAPGINAAQALALGAKLRELVAAHEFGGGVRLSLSLGVAQAQAEDTRDAFVGRVKAALARAKEQDGTAQA